MLRNRETGLGNSQVDIFKKSPGEGGKGERGGPVGGFPLKEPGGMSVKGGEIWDVMKREEGRGGEWGET